MSIMEKIKNKIGMSILISHPDSYSIEKQIPLFADAGFDSFFLSCGVTEDFSKIPLWAKIGGRCNIEFEAVHAPSKNVDGVWLGNEYGDRYLQDIESIIDLCSQGGVSKLVVHVGVSTAVPVTDIGLNFWNTLEQYAKKRGVRICYENSNVPEHFEAVVNNSDRYHGICHDIGHQNCYTPTVKYQCLYGERILYTHLHDNFGMRRDLHLLPNDGNIDWNSYFRELYAMGYKGTLNLELSCFHSEKYRNMSFREFVNASYRRITQFSKIQI